MQFCKNFKVNSIVNPFFKTFVRNNNVKASGSVGKKKSKLGPIIEKKDLPVENDPEKLIKYVCGSNIYKEGEDVEIKPDSEYPDWLWSLRLIAKPPPLEEMDPNSKQYWRRIRIFALRRNNQLKKVRKF